MDLKEFSKKSGGNIIKEARKSKNLTRYELQKLSGITTVQIRNIENGISIPRAVTLAKIAEVLELDYDDLYDLFN